MRSPIWIRWLLCLAVFGAAGGLSAVQAADYQALLGTWDVETDDGAFAFVWEFVLEDGALKGIYTGQSGEADMLDLKFEDNQLEFRVDIGMEISFSAFIDGDYLEGTLSLQYGEAAFTGQKRS
jgi:hypothetical protein